MNNNEITTILGRGSSFAGKLTFEGAVRIDGHFKGEIQTDGMLVLGETADVQAEIRAATVVVQGSVRGEIVATESLEIQAPARVYGNLTTPSLTIQKGSLFQGQSRMEGDSARVPLTNGKSQPAAEVPAEA